MKRNTLIRLSVAMLVMLQVGTAAAALLHVPSQYPTIQAAIDAAAAYDEIVVSPGTYSGSGSAIIDTPDKRLTIRSTDGAAVTILDGQNQRKGVVFQGYSIVALHGFTVRNCVGGSGGAEGLESGNSDAMVDGCVFESATLASYGDPQFQNCTWIGVGAGASHAAPSFQSCSFQSGAFFSGSSETTASFTSCTFVDGHDSYEGGWSYAGGAAIKLYLDSGAVIDGCHFENNFSATDGGAIMYDSTNGPDGELIVKNSTFIGNSASDFGGAIYSGDESALIQNCTFHANQAIGVYGRGGALSAVATNVIDSCEFVGNEATYAGGTISFGGAPDLMNSLISNSSVLCIERLGGSGEINISGTVFCGHSESDLGPNWEDLGGNEFNADCEIGTTGSCCVNGGCLELSFEDCTTIVGVFGGLGSSCAGITCDPGSGGNDSCPADVDRNDTVNVHDLMELLERWGPCS